MSKKRNYPGEKQTKRKKFQSRDMIKITPLTKTQELFFQIYRKYPQKNFFLCGSAGTGKTFMAIYLALEEILAGYNRFERLLIVRSAVPAREIGYLPGESEEKLAVYEAPYRAILDEISEYDNSYDNMKDSNIIEFQSTSFLRGTTFNDSIVIVDECQNLSYEELNTIITRIGINSKIIFCGDIRQNDLNKNRFDKTGFDIFRDIINNMPEWFDVVEFKHEDIVRSELVKAYIIQSEKILPHT